MIKLRLSRKKAMGIMHNAQSMEQALKIIRHEHSNYDQELKNNNWDMVRRDFAVKLAILFNADHKVAFTFHKIMKDA